MFLTRQWAKYSLVQSANSLIPHLYNFYPEHSFLIWRYLQQKFAYVRDIFSDKPTVESQDKFHAFVLSKNIAQQYVSYMCVCVEGDIFLHIKRRQNNFLRNLTSRDRAPRLAPF